MSWLRWSLMAAIGLHFTVFPGYVPVQAAEDQPKSQKPLKAAAVAPKLDKAALEKQFAEKMTGAVFSGHFTAGGQGGDKPPQMEKYTISKAVQLPEGYWLFTARVQYGDHDVTVPMTLQVEWAGDTPVITLTDLTIPGLGTFTSRVLVYGDQYAGTWQHGTIGGHLWGKLEREKPEGDRGPKKEGGK